MLARQPRNQVRRDRRLIAERFIELARDLIDKAERLLLRQRQRDIVQANGSRNPLRVFQLVKVAVFEPDGERLQRDPQPLGDSVRHQRGIHPA